MNDNSGLQRFEGTCDQGGASETLIEYTPGAVHIGVWPTGEGIEGSNYAVWSPKQAKRIAKAIKLAAREAERLARIEAEEVAWDGSTVARPIPYCAAGAAYCRCDAVEPDPEEAAALEAWDAPSPYLPSPPQGSDSVLRQPRAGEVWRMSADGLDDYADTGYYNSASAVRLAFYDAPDGTLWYIRTNHGDPGWINPWESVADKHRWIYSHGLHGSSG